MTLVRVASSTSYSEYQSAGFHRAASRSCLPDKYRFDSGGRSYGGSTSRPTIRIEPSAPPERSVAAQPAAAPPPPTSRESTSRSALQDAAAGAPEARLFRLQERRGLFLPGGGEDAQHPRRRRAGSRPRAQPCKTPLRQR